MAEHAHHEKPDHLHDRIPKEDAHGNVHQPAGGVTISTIARIEMLLGHDRHPPAERVAEIMVEHPHAHEHVYAWLHKYLGNSYVQRVQRAMADAKAAHAHDASFVEHGTKATGHENAYAAPHDPNRMMDKGHWVKATVDSPIYRADGSAFAGIAAEQGTDLRIETGAVRTLAIAGKHIACVLVFRAGPKDASKPHATGWIPVDHTDAQAKHAGLLKADEQIAESLRRDGQHTKFAATPRTIVPKQVSAEDQRLRILPNQKVGGHENLAEHYCERPGGVVNLLSNVPGGSAGRMGVAIDVVVGGMQFFPAAELVSEYTPLWHSGEGAAQTDRRLEFVYGKVETPTGPRYGWINKAMLG